MQKSFLVIRLFTLFLLFPLLTGCGIGNRAYEPSSLSPRSNSEDKPSQSKLTSEGSNPKRSAGDALGSGQVSNSLRESHVYRQLDSISCIDRNCNDDDLMAVQAYCKDQKGFSESPPSSRVISSKDIVSLVSVSISKPVTAPVPTKKTDSNGIVYDSVEYVETSQDYSISARCIGFEYILE
jgi:hypothetical protein